MKFHEGEDTLLTGVCFQDIMNAGFNYVALIPLVHVHTDTLCRPRVRIRVYLDLWDQRSLKSAGTKNKTYLTAETLCI